jgi:hypothetical protein
MREVVLLTSIMLLSGFLKGREKNKSAKRFVSSNERSRRLFLKLSTSGVLVEKRAACGAITFFDYAFTYPQHHHL